jgi:hypothetical protein
MLGEMTAKKSHLKTGSRVMADARLGLEKINICSKQVARDGIQYFWVDSCRIKKSSNSNLSESINYIFRWYRRAAKCYVYLSDISIGEHDDVLTRSL